MTRDMPTAAPARVRAKRLREDLAPEGTAISRAQALERVVHRHGFRDGNALHAAIRDRPPRGWTAGGRVRGRCLSRPYAAIVRSAEPPRSARSRPVLDLDETVDVVRSESFSNLRNRIALVVGSDGHSKFAPSTPQFDLMIQSQDPRLYT